MVMGVAVLKGLDRSQRTIARNDRQRYGARPTPNGIEEGIAIMVVHTILPKAFQMRSNPAVLNLRIWEKIVLARCK
jgi:hypothetical protein